MDGKGNDSVYKACYTETSNEWLGRKFRVCDSWLHVRSKRQGLNPQEMKAWACQQIVRYSGLQLRACSGPGSVQGAGS